MNRIDIKSEREFLREIFDKIEKGTYAIPVFQRDFVWKQHQVVDLFDSIWNGYPIGSIILWQPDTPMLSKDILTDEKLDYKVNPQYFVLDGRQRLSAFYGCVQNSRPRNKKFDLYFNLATCKFSFKNIESVTNLKVSDIYDTFTLLSKLQDIVTAYKADPQKAKQYVDIAKKLNSILQGYTISEVYINKCSLKQAEIVFSRINSKGTDINKTFMLQAVTYSKGGLLLTEEIDGIRENLNKYNFASLSSDDILQCFYKFVGKNFYDASMSDLENMDFSTQLPSIRSSIVKSVAFLYEECYVWDAKLLPYTKQLIALTWFFKEYENPDNSQKRELKKWFFYTSFTQVFQNSSLSNVRKVFRRFESFIKKEESTAIEYHQYIKIGLMDFTFNQRNAQTDILIISMIRKAFMSKAKLNLEYKGTYKLRKGKKPQYYFACLTNEDILIIDDIMESNVSPTEETLERFCLTNEIISAYRNKDYHRFEKLRYNIFAQAETDLLDEENLGGDNPIIILQ